jgi:hypothetical protein
MGYTSEGSPLDLFLFWKKLAFMQTKMGQFEHLGLF